MSASNEQAHLSQKENSATAEQAHYDIEMSSNVSSKKEAGTANPPPAKVDGHGSNTQPRRKKLL
jgi:hypothetical protein